MVGSCHNNWLIFWCFVLSIILCYNWIDPILKTVTTGALYILFESFKIMIDFLDSKEKRNWIVWRKTVLNAFHFFTLPLLPYLNISIALLTCIAHSILRNLKERIVKYRSSSLKLAHTCWCLCSLIFLMEFFTLLKWILKKPSTKC